MTITVTTDRTLFRQTIIAWLNAYTGIDKAKIIWANQSTPRPDRPYATVFFPSGSVKSGFDEAVANYNAGTQAIERMTHGPRTIAVQVEVYTDQAQVPNQDEAYELLENALLALDTVPMRESFAAAKIGLLDHAPVQKLDEQLADRWERRAMAELTVTYSGETFDDGGGGSGNWIETADVPSEANGKANYGT
jgi:hypothetical protein